MVDSMLPFQVLVSTSTLAWGVNLPAHLVIIKVKSDPCYDIVSTTQVLFEITLRLCLLTYYIFCLLLSLVIFSNASGNRIFRRENQKIC